MGEFPAGAVNRAVSSHRLVNQRPLPVLGAAHNTRSSRHSTKSSGMWTSRPRFTLFPVTPGVSWLHGERGLAGHMAALGLGDALRELHRRAEVRSWFMWRLELIGRDLGALDSLSDGALGGPGRDEDNHCQQGQGCQDAEAEHHSKPVIGQEQLTRLQGIVEFTWAHLGRQAGCPALPSGPRL